MSQILNFGDPIGSLGCIPTAAGYLFTLAGPRVDIGLHGLYPQYGGGG